MATQQKPKHPASLNHLLPLMLKDKVIYDAEGKIFIVWVGAKRKDIDRAKFMVKACNSYHQNQETIKELLEACKNAHSALKTLFYNHPTDDVGSGLIAHLESAITKAEKGE